jgi:uncharacterized protein (TIGR01777 family)
MRVLVTGASGLIGSALVPRLAEDGHEVRRLVRSPDDLGPDRFLWDPGKGRLDLAAFDGVDGVINLAGETIAGRWSSDKKKRIHDSRVAGTRLVCEAMEECEHTPSVLVCASAAGYYGDRGDEVLTEESEPGTGFLADVVRDWEAACDPAREAGIRVVNIRSGEVLSREGGALEALLPPFRLGLGGPIGGGRQYMSWITIDDEVDAIRHVLGNADIEGAVNLVSPGPVTNREFAKTLGRTLGRPAVLPTPTFPLRLVYGGDFVEEVLLASERIQPERLRASGFQFEHPELEPALRHVLGK